MTIDDGDEEENTAIARGYDAFCASLRQASPERIKRRKQFQKYFEHPKGKIEALTLIAVAVYACFTYRLMDISQGQLDTMRADQRAWLEPAVSVDEDGLVSMHEATGSSPMLVLW